MTSKLTGWGTGKRPFTHVALPSRANRVTRSVVVYDWYSTAPVSELIPSVGSPALLPRPGGAR